MDTGNGIGQQLKAVSNKKKNSIWIWIAAAVVAVAAFLILPRLRMAKPWQLRSGFITEDGSSAYILLPGGKSVLVQGAGIEDAEISEDLKHVAVLTATAFCM